MNRLSKWLVSLAALVVIVFGMKQAAPVITQILLVVFLAIVISPLYYILRRWRFPSWLALTLILASLTLVCLYVATVVVSGAVLDFTKQVPAYHAQFQQTVQAFRSWLIHQDVDVPEMLFADVIRIDSAVVSSLVKQAGGIAGSFFKSAILILIILAFILCELPSLPERVKSQRWMTPSLWDRLVRIVLDVRHYMGIKTIICAGTGLFVYVGMRLMGVDSPLLLGVLAFVLNYVPMVGSILAAVPAVLITLIQQGSTRSVFVAIFYIAVNIVFGNVLEPRLMGYGFGVSPVLVLFSVVFWGWVLGPLGMLLAVPLTMAVRAALGSMMREFSDEQDVSGFGLKRDSN